MALIRRLSRLLPVLVLLALVAAVRGQATGAASKPATPQRFFWKITSPTTEVYLLGSIHVATDDMYPLPPEIEKAYQGVKSLAVEADVTKVNQLAMAMQVMQMGMYSGEDTLDKHISADSMKGLTAYCQTAGLPIETLKSMKPALAAMTVEALFIQQQGLQTDKGIDLHFLNQANQAKNKNIVELESTDAQMKLLFSIDDKLAEKWLGETLKDSSKDELDKTIKAWMQGDDKALAAQMTDDEKNDPDGLKINDMLIYQRNGAMAEKIDSMLKGKDKTLVVVGAAHLIGDKGVLKLLEAKGYKVERPALTNPPKP